MPYNFFLQRESKRESIQVSSLFLFLLISLVKMYNCLYFVLLCLPYLFLVIQMMKTLDGIYLCVTGCAKAFDCVDHNKLWEIVKEMGISDHLTCLLRNPYAGQEATVRNRYGATDWFKIRKGVC